MVASDSSEWHGAEPSLPEKYFDSARKKNCLSQLIKLLAINELKLFTVCHSKLLCPTRLKKPRFGALHLTEQNELYFSFHKYNGITFLKFWLLVAARKI